MRFRCEQKVEMMSAQSSEKKRKPLTETTLQHHIQGRVPRNETDGGGNVALFSQKQEMNTRGTSDGEGRDLLIKDTQAQGRRMTRTNDLHRDKTSL